MSPMSKFLNRQWLLVSRPCCWRHNYAGQGTSPEWRTIVYLRLTLYGELSSGHRDRGAPKKRYKDSLRKSLGVCHIDWSQWSALAVDRAAWRYTVHQAVSSFEASRKEDLREKRCRRKIRAAPAATWDQGLWLQPLRPDLLVPYWTCSSSARLQSAWTATFI